MDRLFLDANVLFALAYGAPRLRWLIEQARQGRFRLLVSPYVCEEARRNLPDDEARQRLQELRLTAHCVPEPSLDVPMPVALPEKDIPVLAAAIVSGATHLLTGDFQHFGPYFGRTVLGVTIMTPAQYRRYWESREREPGAPTQ